MDTRPARLGGACDRSETLGSGPAAVEAHERVASVDRDCRPVEELLDRETLGCDAGGLADLQGALGGRPLVRPRSGQFEQAQRRLHAQLTLERRLDRRRHLLEPLERRAEGTGQLRQAQQRAQVARGEGGAALLLDRLDVDAGRPSPADHDDGAGVRSS